MRIVREFACELTGDECLIIRDEKGDETCMLKEDYDNLDKYEKFDYFWKLEEKKICRIGITLDGNLKKKMPRNMDMICL